MGGMVNVKPGAGPLFEKAFDKYNKPLFDQLVADGKASSWAMGYELAEQAVHSDGSFTHEAWITFSELANLDKVDQAIEKAFSEMSAGDEVARKIAFMKMVKPESHFDRLIRVWKHSE
jgi:hypothetical protein